MNYRQIPCNLEFAPKDKRDFTLDKYNLGDDNYTDHYVMPINTPILNQGYTSMCLDFTYRSIEEEQFIQRHNEYKEFANGYRYGQKLFSSMEGMVEAFEVNNYIKGGIPFASSFNVVGTSQECKDYYNANITDEIKAEALTYRNRAYITVETPEEVIKGIINFMSSGYIGVDIYDSFYLTGEDGIVPAPIGNSIGGHAMKLKGVKLIDGEQYYVVQNSWGTDFGDGGYIYIKCDSSIIRIMRIFADATPENESIDISINDPVVKTLKGNITMDVPPFIQNDRTYVPLRFISEALGYEVSWFANSGTQKLGLVRIEKPLS